MQTDSLLDFSMVSAEVGSTINLLLKIIAPKDKVSKKQKPLNLCLVLDCSGSMSGAKLQNTKEAAKLIISRLDKNDTLSIVTFCSVIQTLFPPRKVDSPGALCQLIDSIYANGGTNLSGGVLKGIEYLADMKTSETINRLILLSDGQANQGITSTTQLVNISASAKAENKIIISCMGFGEMFNEDLLSEMSKAATGNFYYVKYPSDAPEIFAEELHDIRNLVAQNISVTIEQTDIVEKIEQVTAHPQLHDGKKLIVELGDTLAGEEKRLLLSLFIPKLQDLGQVCAGEAKIRFTELTKKSVSMKSISQKIEINVDDSDTDTNTGPQMEVLQELALQECASVRREAIKKADASDFKASAKVLRATAEKLEKLPKSVMNEYIREEIKSLRLQADALDAVEDNRLESNTVRKAMMTDTTTISIGKYHKLATGRITRSSDKTPPKDTPDKKDDQDSESDKKENPDSEGADNDERDKGKKGDKEDGDKEKEE